MKYSTNGTFGIIVTIYDNALEQYNQANFINVRRNFMPQNGRPESKIFYVTFFYLAFKLLYFLFSYRSIFVGKNEKIYLHVETIDG